MYKSFLKLIRKFKLKKFLFRLIQKIQNNKKIQIRKILIIQIINQAFKVIKATAIVKIFLIQVIVVTKILN